MAKCSLEVLPHLHRYVVRFAKQVYDQRLNDLILCLLMDLFDEFHLFCICFGQMMIFFDDEEDA